MIYATVNLTLQDDYMKADRNITLYRGDKNVEIRFVLKGNKFVVLENTYAQMLIRRPSARSVFSEPALMENNTVVFTITTEMIDEIKEIGSYTFQIRLYDDQMVARATLPPCEGCLIIKQPIAVEGEATINVAMINDSAVMSVADVEPVMAAYDGDMNLEPAAYTPEVASTNQNSGIMLVDEVSEDEVFTEDNKYNRTVWLDGDIITDTRMNKIEYALYQINETRGSNSNVTAPYISTFLPESIMVGTEEDFELDLEFRSPNLGNGTLKVFINDVDSLTMRIDQGITTTIVPGSLFTKGTNMVVVYVLDRAGTMTNSLTFYVRYGGTEVTSTFDAYSAYDYGSTVRYYFTPTSLDTSLPLTFFMEIDGVTQEGIPCTSDVRSYYTFPTTLAVGNHYCRAWVFDGTHNSNILTFNIVILDATSLVVASDTTNLTVEEGVQISLDYKVYMKNNTSFITKTYVDGTLVNTGTCTLETSYYRTTNLKQGTHTIKVSVWDITETRTDSITWTVVVTPSTYELLSPVEAGSVFMASAYSKSNVDENRDVWIGTNQDNESIEAELTNFSFNSENGWINDSLVISGNSWVEIPVSPLANNAQYGFTLDIEFSTRPIGAEGAEVLSLWNETDNCGIKITTEQLIIRSKSGNQADLYFGEDEVVSAIFVIDRDEKTAKIYLNGVMCEAFALSDYEAAGQKYLEDFTVNSNVFLGGYNKNGYCAIKNIRIYEVALATNEILNNYMSNEKDKLTQKKLVDFQKGDNLPTLTIYCDFAGLGKDDKKPCNIVYNSPDVNLYGESFTLDGKHSTLQYQGTSSMQYPIKNYRINPRNADGKVKLDPFNNGVGESRFTLKADFMSSGHWQNTGLAKWVNDKLYNYNVNDESTMNARKWYDLQNGGSLKDTRESINGFPCRLILINDGETVLNEGQQEPTPGNTKDMGIFNFNNDKDNVETLGFDTDIFPNCMSFEVTANSDTSAGAFVPYTPTIKVFNDGNYETQWFNTSEWSSLTVLLDNRDGKMTWFNELGGTAYDQASIKADGTTSVNPQSKAQYPYFNFILYGINNTSYEKITINGVEYNIEFVDSRTELYSEVITKNSNKELEYLQQSFELRYPDADDVGEDYGYLGMEMEVLKTDYYVAGGGTIYWSNQIEHDYFGSNELVVSDNVCDVIGYNSAEGMTVLQKVDGKVNIKTSSEYPYIGIRWKEPFTSCTVNGVTLYAGEEVNTDIIKKNPYVEIGVSQDYGLKRVIDWVGNCTDEEFLAEFDQYFHRDYTLRYYLLVITLGMVDNLGKNMMLDTFDGKIWLPRFYDMDTICSYDNSGEIKFDVDIEMEQGYWNTSSSRLWTKIRDLMHDELVVKYNDMRQNGMSYESFMSYFYDKQIAQIPQTYYNKDYDVKYAPYADEYMGKAHGNGYDHLKRWLKRRLIFTDTLFDYAPSYENDKITIRANTLDLMSLEIETYTPVYQHISFYNGNMEKAKIDGKTSTIFTGTAQTATDQEVLIYGGTNIKAIRGIPTMNPNSMLIGNASRLTELDLSNCPILSVVNSNKANFAPHTYLNKLNISNCPQLGGTLNVSNSPLLQNLNALGTTVDNILFPTSVRNLSTLRVPKTVTSLTLTDAGLLYTLEMEEGNNLQSISLTNCNNLTETINFDLTQVPTVLLDNSYNGEELYMSDTTNLTLKNMSSLKRVIFTPNSEYSAFDINNVLNGANYKITTFNNPMMTDFITTAPHRVSYKNDEYKKFIEASEKVYTLSDMTEDNLVNWQTGEDVVDSAFSRLSYTEVCAGDTIKVDSTHIYTTDTSDLSCWVILYDNGKNYRGAVSSSGCYGVYNTTNGEAVILDDGYMRIRMCDDDTDGKVYYTSQSKTVMTKDITPNTAFTANTLDLADTQFQNVKFLCTTDVYNLKVPTTMKNFYADSAMDIDTDVIGDASYEVIHEELIEPYTTNYEGEVWYQSEEVTSRMSYPNIGYFNSQADTFQNTTKGMYTDYIDISNSTTFKITVIECDANQKTRINVYDKDKNFIAQIYDTWTSYLQGVISNIFDVSEYHYLRVSYDGTTCVTDMTYNIPVTPNIIPSSANGSLIFNMYSNNTTQPTSTSPYMWDLTGLKLEDFHTYGMNNWVKASDESVKRITNIPFIYGATTNSTAGNPIKFRKDTYQCMFVLRVEPGEVYSFTRINDTDGTAPYYGFGDSYYDSNWNTVYVNPGYSAYGSGTVTVPEGAVYAIFTPKYIMEYNRPYIDKKHYIPIGDGSYLYVTPTEDCAYNYTTGDFNDSIVLDAVKSIVSTPTGGNSVLVTSPTSITMPQRMPGYSVRLVNADITPNEYPTMLYPKLIDTTLPITGKLDYTKYNGTSLAWAYAYTTGDVSINPLSSKYMGQITNDYNKLYNTDFVDLVDIWAYKDDDFSSKTTNEVITKAYIELTSDNYTTRIDEVLQWYPNCTDLYLFDDGSVTTLNDMLNTNNTNHKSQIANVTFLDGYFDSLTNMNYTFNGCASLTTPPTIPNSVTDMSSTFCDCTSLTTAPTIPNSVIKMDYTFNRCTSLTTPPTIPNSVTNMLGTFRKCSFTTAPTIGNSVTNMQDTFYGCTSLTTPPTIPNSVTTMKNTFCDCTSLTTAPTIPNSVTDMNSTFKNCTSLTQPPVVPQGVENMGDCFYGCTKLTTAPTIPKKANVMGSCFRDCDSLTQGADTNTERIEYGGLYRGCDNLISATIPVGKIMTYDYQRNDTFLDCKKLENVTFVGKARTSINFSKCFKITGSDTAPTYWTNVSNSVKDLVNNHIYNFSEARISNDGSSYIDIPFEDMDYNNIYDMEVRCDVNSSGSTPIVGANGTYNMCTLTLNMMLRQAYINMFGTGVTLQPPIEGRFFNGDTIRYNRNGIYYNGELVKEHTLDEFNRSVINDDETPFRLFGKAGYQATICPGDSIYHVTFRDEQGNVIMHLEPYNGTEGVGFKNTVTNKVYTNSGDGTLTYVDHYDSGEVITLGETLLSYLTEDEIAQATAKGWTIQ